MLKNETEDEKNTNSKFIFNEQKNFFQIINSQIYQFVNLQKML